MESTATGFILSATPIQERDDTYDACVTGY